MPKMLNGDFEVGDALPDPTAALLAITWTTGEPTASNTQTIADGGTPTVAELGQAVQNINTILTALLADIAAIKATLS